MASVAIPRHSLLLRVRSGIRLTSSVPKTALRVPTYNVDSLSNLTSSRDIPLKVQHDLGIISSSQFRVDSLSITNLMKSLEPLKLTEETVLEQDQVTEPTTTEGPAERMEALKKRAHREHIFHWKKCKKTHGFLTRLKTVNGRKMLQRKWEAGRRRLSPG
eukprot:TRINITY_DN2474_c0_g1::TRINITY_DN2474_c0_g1_i1::g.8749::m.8749 TRINITY_DN2474_c0_g1::TRINITY_DN2474_c0_g1_i1::g.8749  ORF type:complete len:174 (-),score=15.23,Ribosomal_L34/PF00468.12/2.3e-08,RdRP_3/PF00998.18/0.11 TRINITY_DN2474_c0_g1_i1:8-487(-)